MKMRARAFVRCHRACLRDSPASRRTDHAVRPQSLGVHERVQSTIAASGRPTDNVVVTTPIFYVNSAPHVGHLYTSLLADASARYHRLARALPSGPPPSADAARPVLMVTGTDEHGQKVAEAAGAAKAASAPPGTAALSRDVSMGEVQTFVDGVAASFHRMGESFSIQGDAFIRTTQPRHAAVVRWLWRRLAARGALQQREYAGWYCRSDEAFVTETQTCTRAALRLSKSKSKKDYVPTEEDMNTRVSIESGHVVEWVTETNWVFPLASYREQLLQLFDTAPQPLGFVYPPDRGAQVRAAIAGQGLQEYLSVSRPSSRVPWAIRVPGDDSQSVYVWLDALANYLTACRGPQVQPEDGTELPDDTPVEHLFPHWPGTGPSSSATRVLHVVGKDIAKFHAIYWPAFLIAAGLAPPSHIITHAHFTVDHVKMSKSLGNVVDPFSLIAPKAHHAPDAVRYFLLREGSHSTDADYNDFTVEQRCVKECAQTFGNLANRLATSKFVPLGRATLAVGQLDMPWSDLGPGLAQGHKDMGGFALPPLMALTTKAGSGLPAAVGGYAVLQALSPDLRSYLWPEPTLGSLKFNTAQAGLLKSLVELGDKASTAYAEARGGSALFDIMAVLQEANKVHFENAPWKITASDEDVQAWRAHARGLLDRATAAVDRALQDKDVQQLLKAGGNASSQDVADAVGDRLSTVLRAGDLPEAPAAPVLNDTHIQLASAIFSVLETLRVSCVLFQPAMPTAAPALLKHLGFDALAYGPDGFVAKAQRAHGGAAWQSGRLGAVAPHHYLIGRHADGASASHPFLAGPAPGPVLFPQPFEPDKRRNALGKGGKGGKAKAPQAAAGAVTTPAARWLPARKTVTAAEAVDRVA